MQGARVEKIYQLNREETVFPLRIRLGQFKLLTSVHANSARTHFTRFVPENPKQPPMLCMLMRKRLSGAKLLQIRQPQLERLLFLDFEAVSEPGNSVRLTVVSGIMGRYSNITLVDEEGRVIDALRRIDDETGLEQLVLPVLWYELPPVQGRLCLLGTQPQQVLAAFLAQPKGMELLKEPLSVLQGVSPIVCREIQYRVGHGKQVLIHGMTDSQKEHLLFFLGYLKQEVEE